MSICSLRGLYAEMKKRFNISYIMTAKLNQDALENLFSVIRARGGGNDHPSPLECLRRLRVIILGKNIQSVSAGQSTKDGGEEEFAIMDILRSLKSNKSETPGPGHDHMLDDEGAEDEVCSEEVEAIENAEASSSNFNTDDDGLEYIAGATARKFKDKHPYAGNFTYQTRDEYVQLGHFHLLDHDYVYPKSYVDHLSHGGLFKPSNQWLGEAKQIDILFKNYHKDKISKERNVVANVSRKVNQKYPSIPIDLVNYFVRLRTYIRISTLNRLLKQEKQEKASVKRLKKPLNTPFQKQQKKMKKVLM